MEIRYVEKYFVKATTVTLSRFIEPKA